MIFARSPARRALAGLMTLIGLAGPAGATDVPPPHGPLVMEEFFAGRTVGDGVFRAPIAGVERRFRVIADGSFDGRTLILKEHIVYEDGQVVDEAWRFEKLARGGYDGKRTHVATIVPVRVDESGIVSMGYVATVAGPDGTERQLRFDDELRLTGPRTVLNTARVRWFGLPIGTVEVTFRK
ncbi:DUF3833 family protein [Methylobrevis albus]|uniref:DUF3833 family protein n=1 Tax=Methylobrevis albus TaxID=2793297 RepID=A0A931I0I0_9HYPH|nr:DUF3833 family protein [Methylobrevis albus]MBH0237095.1 DUF3833 family protein [Methylobrevis albus]